MKVDELMTTDVSTVGRNDELSVADDIMKMKRVRHLPVLEDGRLVGVLSQRDLLLAALSTAMGFGQKASREFLKTVPVKEVMTDDVISVARSDDVTKAAHLMIDHKIGCLPVLGDEARRTLDRERLRKARANRLVAPGLGPPCWRDALGIQHAAMATTKSTIAIRRYIGGSVALTPYSRLERRPPPR